MEAALSSEKALLDYWYLLPIGLAVSYVVYIRLFSPLAGVPGPFFASLSRLWLAERSWKGDMHRTMMALHERYGSVVRTAPNEVSVASPAALKVIYAHGSRYRKSDWYSVWQGRRKFDLFGTRDEKIHGAHRRLVASAYSMTSLRDLEQYVDSAIGVFLKQLRDKQSQVFDLGLWIQLLAFDVIGEVTFAQRFGFLENGQDDGSFDQIKKALGSAAWIGQMPWLYWLHDALTPVFGNHLAISARHGTLRSFAAKEVAARKARGTDRKDILSKLFAVQKEKPNELDDVSVISMATSNIFAGSDTTAISLRATIFHILRNPKCKERLIGEIEEVRRKEIVGELFSLDQTSRMPYLQACMFEALRCNPPVGMSLPRVVPAGGLDIDGHFIPEGHVVGVNPWVIHRNPDIFGDDVEAYKPERWLSKERKAEMERFFFAFGQGARICIGRNLSWMEMSKALPALFENFEVELADPSRDLGETCWWFVLNEGLAVVLRPRVKNTN